MFSDIHRLLDSIERQLGELRAQVQQLEQAQGVSTPRHTPEAPPPTDVHAKAPLAAKISLFTSRFRGRTDVYAYKWQHSERKGWSPATPFRGSEEYLPLTDNVIDQHLRGNQFIGVYPMLPDDSTHFLACDFDDALWRQNARAYADACAARGVDNLVEISSSGAGAHVWIFFEEPVPARQARALGFQLLREAMAQEPNMDFTSYDRFFPAQDTLPIRSKGRGRLGNLIALPLQGTHRRQGTTVFVDPNTWQPYDDQFSALSAVKPLDIQSVVFDEPIIGPASELTVPKPRKSELHTTATVDISVDSHLRVPLDGLPASIIASLKHLACLSNPEFYRRQAQRFSTFRIPRLIIRFHQENNILQLPRGLTDEVIELLETAGATVHTKRQRARQRLQLEFTGKLRPPQQRALRDTTPHRTGVIVAPPGFGKTVLGCSMIAHRNVPTAVLVNRKELVDQWRTSLSEFLGCTPGQLGAGKRKLTGEIDIIMMQSISHRDANTSVLDDYDHIVVDECHSIASPATEAAITDARAPYWLGLTATPFRADHMDELITMQLGPIRHQAIHERVAQREIVLRTTNFITEEPATDGASMNAIYSELTTDTDRNALIIADICSAATEGRTSLVLSNRIEHLHLLQELLQQQVTTPIFLLHGQLPPQERSSTLETLRKLEGPFILLAIDKVAGEGFDLPQLNTLFLTIPVSFKGRIIQQIGRVTRSDHPALVYDYVDEQVPWLHRMAQRRRRIIAKEGFTPRHDTLK
ncbi:DEAD/DEAH box helicase [Corynebacterium freiburgense]|uniref:DEAD/DEAH box helicase n=1 Tax=Corynebacterium freiburgense TaxID=556548 RepID=UPI00040A31CB|nr:DEAD/DEAH box helicase [Corynebacterium freiburgense]WJZ02232.1 Type III restriction enzyme, res subunit [Corynebacterium freiburgense]